MKERSDTSYLIFIPIMHTTRRYFVVQNLIFCVWGIICCAVCTTRVVNFCAEHKEGKQQGIAELSGAGVYG